MLLMPLDAYVAATCSSTFFGSTFDFGPRRSCCGENEKPGSTSADLRQVAHEHRRQIDDVRALRAARANRQAEQHAIGVRQLAPPCSVGLPRSAVNRTLRRTS